MIWGNSRDGDPVARALMRRHYSARHYRDRRQHDLFCGPGEKTILVELSGRGVFIWRKFIDDSGQVGVNCAAFRNESPHLSSDMIREADDLAWARWPGERHYSYVDAEKTSQRRGRNAPPGKCFIEAGWRPCGFTKGGLVVLERRL